MLSFLNRVQIGTVPPASLVTAETTKQVFSLDLSKAVDLEKYHRSGINSIDIECTENRYILSGSADGSLAIHDLENHEGQPKYTSKLIGSVKRKSRHAHQFSVERVQWYPLDTGIFSTCGMDSKVKLWDTNALKPVDTYKLQGKVYSHDMAKFGPKHSLIAAALSTPHVTLIDILTGSNTHELKAHKGSVLSVRWSPTAEHLLATGGMDNKIFLWDVRSAKKHLASLDRHNGSSAGQASITAHGGAVNNITFTPDGQYLVSFGTDDRVRLWDVALCRNTLVNYGKVENVCKKGLQLELCYSANPQLLFVPSEHNIQVFDLFDGSPLHTLMGHFNSVNCCMFRLGYHEMYSGGNDRNILVWSALTEQLETYEESLRIPSEKESGRTYDLVKRLVTADAWSDDESEGE